jgi:hypothetical protein
MWEHRLLSVLCKWEGDKLSGKRFKIFFFPASAWAGKKGNNAVQNDTVLVFFFLRKRNVIWKKKKNLGVTQKWVMTVAPLFTMLTEQRLCVESL